MKKNCFVIKNDLRLSIDDRIHFSFDFHNIATKDYHLNDINYYKG